ncbi:MAG: hypothetical protein RMM17_05350 [Acidobacteriota bacterium]|nr:hypothetical protein [Blastocatellia bacterium]MDW8412090.1 hypothetical protein [Acidobacteriota bacterium]
MVAAELVLVVLVAPLTGFIFNNVFAERFTRLTLSRIALLCTASSLLAATYLAYITYGQSNKIALYNLMSKPIAIEVSFLLDKSTCRLMLLVTLVALLAHIALRLDLRFANHLNLFLAVTLTSILSANSVVTLVSWTLISLCSYLLLAQHATTDDIALESQFVPDLCLLLSIAYCHAFYGNIVDYETVGLIDRKLPAALMLFAIIGKSLQTLPLLQVKTLPFNKVLLITASSTLAAAALMLQIKLAISTVVATVGMAAAIITAIIAGSQIAKVAAYFAISQTGYALFCFGLGASEAAVLQLATQIPCTVLLALATTQRVSLTFRTLVWLTSCGAFPSGFWFRTAFIATASESVLWASIAFLALTSTYLARTLLYRTKSAKLNIASWGLLLCASAPSFTINTPTFHKVTNFALLIFASLFGLVVFIKLPKKFAELIKLPLFRLQKVLASEKFGKYKQLGKSLLGTLTRMRFLGQVFAWIDQHLIDLGINFLGWAVRVMSVVVRQMHSGTIGGYLKMTVVALLTALLLLEHEVIKQLFLLLW